MNIYMYVYFVHMYSYWLVKKLEVGITRLYTCSALVATAKAFQDNFNNLYSHQQFMKDQVALYPHKIWY